MKSAENSALFFKKLTDSNVQLKKQQAKLRLCQALGIACLFIIREDFKKVVFINFEGERASGCILSIIFLCLEIIFM